MSTIGPDRLRYQNLSEILVGRFTRPDDDSVRAQLRERGVVRQEWERGSTEDIPLPDILSQDLAYFRQSIIPYSLGISEIADAISWLIRKPTRNLQRRTISDIATALERSAFSSLDDSVKRMNLNYPAFRQRVNLFLDMFGLDGEEGTSVLRADVKDPLERTTLPYVLVVTRDPYIPQSRQILTLIRGSNSLIRAGFLEDPIDVNYAGSIATLISDGESGEPRVTVLNNDPRVPGFALHIGNRILDAIEKSKNTRAVPIPN